jgi:hypothetical protein
MWDDEVLCKAHRLGLQLGRTSGPAPTGATTSDRPLPFSAFPRVQAGTTWLHLVWAEWRLQGLISRKTESDRDAGWSGWSWRKMAARVRLSRCVTQRAAKPRALGGAWPTFISDRCYSQDKWEAEQSKVGTLQGPLCAKIGGTCGQEKSEPKTARVGTWDGFKLLKLRSLVSGWFYLSTAVLVERIWEGVRVQVVLWSGVLCQNGWHCSRKSQRTTGLTPDSRPWWIWPCRE